MVSENIETILNDAAHKVVWGDTKPSEYLADWVGSSMLSEEWDPFEMFQFEMMALMARKQNGFDQPPEQD
jgi:hypothetical protein